MISVIIMIIMIINNNDDNDNDNNNDDNDNDIQGAHCYSPCSGLCLSIANPPAAEETR